ncbi:MAG TPA: Holliday junction branch migration protein RuvA [Bacteroidales bacterium]|nr:Holliday junction branch migration protein RuvA [Bacteroidales bacterium]HQB19974.1 Holliday junction branch migration protein RuvA [Bacteroidales bacterium]
MIAYIQGKLIEKTPTYAVIDCSGVGFMLNISLNTYSALPDVNQDCKLFAHLSIKEDAHTLYAFASEAERQIFRLLITVSGIGVNTARMILSSINHRDLVTYISSENADILQSIKGIGAKTAQRIIIDLKDKILKTDIEPTETLLAANNNNANEALSALILLGFSKQVAGKAISKVLKSSSGDLSVEELIKHALKIL